MEIKTTKKNGGKKPKRVLAPQKLTRLELKHAQARAIRCFPWLADPQKP